MEKEFYIIRHGETDYNRRGIVQGRGINSELNETGWLQANLFHKKYQDIPFEKVYTSSLIRTQQTVKNFIDQGIQHEIHEGLDEINWGIFEGKSTSRKDQMAFYNIVSGWKKNKLSQTVEGGETPLEVQIRQKEFIDHVILQPEKKVLICTHGRAMRIFLCTLLNKELTFMDDYPHQNTTLYIVKYHKKKFSLKQLNNTDHLL